MLVCNLTDTSAAFLVSPGVANEIRSPTLVASRCATLHG